MKTSKRNPSGVVKSKPIALRLLPQERDDADRIASKLNISRSNLARQAYLAGLPTVADDVSFPTA